MGQGFVWQRMTSVARKEFFHIIRDPATLVFSLVIPILELFLLGYAIYTNERNVKTVVFDLANNQESRGLLQRFVNSDTFHIIEYVDNEDDLTARIRGGKARVGIQIPANYSERVMRGATPAQVLILVDGSESSIASSAVSVAEAILKDEGVKQIQPTVVVEKPRVEASTRVLFNPSMRSPNFFIPGLMVVLCQMMSVMLSANAIVREKENGTLEQLFMTPVQSGELIFGKLIPYFVLTLLEFCMFIFLMNLVFRVPIQGPLLTLFAMIVPFIFCCLGLGLWISTRADTRESASQMALGTFLPAIFLSGYVFPLDSMPPFFYYVGQCIPTTWLIDAARGVILRDAGWNDLWLHSVVLWSMGLIVFVLSVLSFRKRL